MLWWYWFLIGAGSVILLEAALVGIIFIIGKKIDALRYIID